LAARRSAVSKLSFAKTADGGQVVDLSASIRRESRAMITLLLHLFRLLPFLFGGHRQLALENLALRQQLSVYKRTMTRPKLRTTDRLLWAGLARVWAEWRQSLVIVTPDTVLRWQRRRFRDHWAKLSGRPTVGRAPVNAAIIALVRRMTAANPPWLHANVALPVHAREQLEHLCRYLLRPPLALERLTESSGGSCCTSCPTAPRWRHAPAARSAGADREAQRPHPSAPVAPAPVPRPPGTPRPASLRRGPPFEPRRRARRSTAAKPFAARAPELSLFRGRKTLLGGPDEASVRGRRFAVQPLRRPTPYRGRLPRWAEATRSP
jgi:hypothetical protein